MSDVKPCKCEKCLEANHCYDLEEFEGKKLCYKCLNFIYIIFHEVFKKDTNEVTINGGLIKKKT